MAKPFNFVSLTKDSQFGTLLRPLCHFWETLQNESMNDPFFQNEIGDSPLSEECINTSWPGG